MEDTSKNRPAGAEATPETPVAAQEQPTVAQPGAPAKGPGLDAAPAPAKRQGRSLSVLATALIGGGALVLGLVVGGGAVALATHDDRGDGRDMHREWAGERFDEGPQDGFDGQRPGGRGERGEGPSAERDGGAEEGRTHVRPDEDSGAEGRAGRPSRERSDAPQDEPSDDPSQKATPEQDPSAEA